jgi:hypothetical protein
LARPGGQLKQGSFVCHSGNVPIKSHSSSISFLFNLIPLQSHFPYKSGLTSTSSATDSISHHLSISHAGLDESHSRQSRCTPSFSNNPQASPTCGKAKDEKAKDEKAKGEKAQKISNLHWWQGTAHWAPDSYWSRSCVRGSCSVHGY